MVHASLFSGIGGPEVAAAMLGWKNAFHCEINPFGKSILDYWFPESKSYEDITKTSFKEWRGKIDVLTGGFPCQPFSYAGKRGGAGDDRYLWPEMLRAINEIRPAWVIGENVAGITTMVEGGILTDLGCYTSMFQEGDNIHGYELEQTYTIERICRDLEGIGYSVQPMLIPAAGVNAPHRRDRVFIIAYDADSDCGDDLRRAGEDEGEGEGEGLQERHSIRKPGIAADVRSEISRTDTDSIGNGCEELGEFGIHGGGDFSTRDYAEREIQGTSSDTGWRSDPGLLPEHRWERFPAVSPVHRGNDGIPIRLDNLSIPFSRWRTESLKAYGNAIVPQVMYRIFQAIEEASK